MSLLLRPRPIGSRVAAIALATLVLSSCSGGDQPGAGETRSQTASTAQATAEKRTFEADNGAVEIPVNPQRIVTVGSPGVFLSLGIAPVGMVGAPDDTWQRWLTPEQQDTYAATTQLGAVTEIDFEKVASLTPDLIVVMVPEEAWEAKRIDEDRLDTFAPVVYLSINPGKSDMSVWKTQLERVAEAVGAVAHIAPERARYDELVAEIRRDYGDYLSATTFAYLLSSTAIEPGTFIREYSSNYCTVAATEAGVNIPGETSTGTKTFEAVSLERLSDLADVDVIVYDVGPDGEQNPGIETVLASEVWKSLPQVREGRAVGVQCDQTLTYTAKIRELESLREALAGLTAR